MSYGWLLFDAAGRLPTAGVAVDKQMTVAEKLSTLGAWLLVLAGIYAVVEALQQ